MINYLVKFLCNRVEIKKCKTEIEESIKKKWPDHVLSIEEVIYYSFEREVDELNVSLNNGNTLIFIDKELDIDWITNKSLSPDAHDNISSVMTIETYPHKHLSKSEIIAFKRILGYALLSAIEGSKEQLELQKKKAEIYISKRIVEKSRSWTLTTCLFVVIPILIILFLNIETINDIELKIKEIFLLTMIFGIFGSFLSIVQRTGSKDLDSSSGIYIHIVGSIVKLLAGGLFGVISYFLGNSNISPVALQTLLTTSYGFISLAFAAGFSERLIPEIISGYNKKTEGKNGENGNID